MGFSHPGLAVLQAEALHGRLPRERFERLAVQAPAPPQDVHDRAADIGGLVDVDRGVAGAGRQRVVGQVDLAEIEVGGGIDAFAGEERGAGDAVAGGVGALAGHVEAVDLLGQAAGDFGLPQALVEDHAGGVALDQFAHRFGKQGRPGLGLFVKLVLAHGMSV